MFTEDDFFERVTTVVKIGGLTLAVLVVGAVLFMLTQHFLAKRETTRIRQRYDDEDTVGTVVLPVAPATPPEPTEQTAVEEPTEVIELGSRVFWAQYEESVARDPAWRALEIRLRVSFAELRAYQTREWTAMLERYGLAR